MTLEKSYSPQATYNQNTVHVLFQVLAVFLNNSNLWLTLWLNTFYSLKIANLTHPSVSLMKRNITVPMPWFLRLSLL